MAQFRYSYDALVYYGEDISKSIDRVARFGYDAIELVGEPAELDGDRIRKLADDAGIAVSSISSVYTAERDLLLAHIAEEVGGRTVFVTGDTHSAAVVERGGVLEVRASPMHTTNHQASSGDGVVFSETGRFFCLVRASGAGLEVNLIRDDGSRAWSTTFD